MSDIDYGKEPEHIVNYGGVPVHIRAPNGPITWRQLGGGWVYREGFTLLLDGTHKDTEHDYLILHVGGFADIYTESGKTIAVGVGIEAGPPDPIGMVEAKITENPDGTMTVELPGTGWS